MASVVRLTRVANPRRRRTVSPRRRASASRTRARSKARNPHRKRRMTTKQIRHFGTARQKAALKRKRNSGRTGSKAKAKRRTRKNPALVVTLGAVNPRRRKTVARHRKTRKANTSHRRRSRRNSTRVVVVAPRRRRRSNPRRHAVTRRRRMNPRRSYRRSRNPLAVFGHGGGKNVGMLIAGGLLGVAAAKILPTLVPAGIIPSSGGFLVKTLVTGVAAYLSGMIAGKWNPTFGDAVLFGGLMQTGSVALNALLPGFSVGGVPLGLSGMGDLIPGSFVVPQNPLRLPPPPPAPATNARVTMNGLARAYGVAL